MQTHYWADLTTEALSLLDRENIIAVLPIAAIEQHGPHLPLSVDTDIINAVISASIKKNAGRFTGTVLADPSHREK